MDEIRGSVTRYSYRSAQVGDVFLQVPRDTVAGLERQLAEKAAVGIDNHVVYKITDETRPPVYILFSDSTATFGSTVLEERW